MGKVFTAIGMMSGTSMDGIDVALIKTDGKSNIERGPGVFFPYDADFRKLLADSLDEATGIVQRSERPGNLEQVEAMLTDRHAEAASGFLKSHSLNPDDIDLIGFHGQTVLHKPETGLTVQLGNGDRLATATGIETVYDLRANDMAFGGQGAPLVPIYHQALANQIDISLTDDKPVVFVNIGGISNITYVGEELLAFDCGPGNALIDQWVQKHVGIPHDDGGMIAAEGKVDAGLVQSYMSDPFFSKSLPKSLDRGDFKLPERVDLSVETVARTLARITAEGILKASDLFPEMPALWIICGGGRHNPHIMEDLSELCAEKGAKAEPAEKVGFDGDMMEAEAWAYLAVRAKTGLPLTFPTTTGVSRSISGGVFASPEKTKQRSPNQIGRK